jgi:ribosomal-protein-alanine N-acetyltransferase
VNRRIQPLSKILAGPLSMLHCTCFPEDPWNSLAIDEIMNITGFFGRIAWADEMPAGFVLALNLCNECEILSIGVLPERRREGIGSTLLDSVCSEARMRGAECIVLEVAADNSAAIALYTNRGFMPVGHRRNYYRQASGRVDGLVLRLALANIMI